MCGVLVYKLGSRGEMLMGAGHTLPLEPWGLAHTWGLPQQAPVPAWQLLGLNPACLRTANWRVEGAHVDATAGAHSTTPFES